MPGGDRNGCRLPLAKQLNQLAATGAIGDRERRRSIHVAKVRIGSGCEQRLDHLGLVRTGRDQERRDTKVVARIDFFNQTSREFISAHESRAQTAAEISERAALGCIKAAGFRIDEGCGM